MELVCWARVFFELHVVEDWNDFVAEACSSAVARVIVFRLFTCEANPPCLCVWPLLGCPALEKPSGQRS
jgi:hypothetical protein